ncbi:calcium-binding EGF-like domain-containing protein, partial [Salmonella enterica subsp. enterica serovar Kentucky]
TRGSYRCSCREGYQLNNDGYTCRGEQLKFGDHY